MIPGFYPEDWIKSEFAAVKTEFADVKTEFQPTSIGSLRDALMSNYGYAANPRQPLLHRKPNMLERRPFGSRDAPLPAIPSLEEIEIPADMPDRLKKDVWRCLKTLKREYEDQSKEEKDEILPEDYARMGSWDSKKKQDRRRMQNRKAARRFRVKNLEVVWAMVTSYQKLKAENQALRQQVQLLGGTPDPNLSVPPKIGQLPPGFIKQEESAVIPAPSGTDTPVSAAEIIKIPPPLPPRGKKRKLDNGQDLIITPGAAWIVQKNAVDIEKQDMLTLTVVCGKQDLTDPSLDQAMIQKLSLQAMQPDFAVQEGTINLSGTMTPVRAPQQWLQALEKITNGQ